MARLTKTMRGLLVHAFEQISADTLNTIDSSYNEAGAQPGDAIAADSNSKLQPEVSAAQNEGLELEVVAAGMPGPDGVGVRWKKTSDGATAERWRAWSSFANITSYQGVKPTLSGLHQNNSFQAATNPITQEVFLTDAFGNAVFYPKNGSWKPTAGSSSYFVNTNYGGNCCFLPDGRLLSVKSVEKVEYGRVLVVSNATATVTGTVTDYSNNPWYGLALMQGSAAAIPGRSRLLFHNNELVFLYGESESGVDLLHQFASADLGTTWRLVESRNQFIESNYDIVSHCGKLYYFYIDYSTNRPTYKTFTSGFEAFSSGTGVEITSDTAEVMAAWTDFDNALYVAHAAAIVGGPPLKLLKSNDNGAIWLNLPNLYESGSTSQVMNISAVSANGSAFLLHTDTASTRSIFCMIVGGFTNTILGNFGDESNYKSAYFPQRLPQDDGWSALGNTADGTITDSFTDIDLNIFSQNASLYYRKTLGTAIRNLSTLITCGKIFSGAIPNAPKVALTVADASSYEYNVAVYFTSNSVTLYDENAGIAIGTATVSIGSLLNGPVQVMLATKYDGVNQLAKAWFKRREETLWTAIVTSYTSLTDSGATASQCEIRFGHQNTSSEQKTVSSWYLVGYTTDTPTENNDAQTVKRLSVLPYPLPEISTSSTVARLSMRSGPGIIGELYSVPVEHDYAVENLLCTVSPSPSTPWRSTDLTQQTIVFRTSEQIATRLGQSWGVGMYLDGCNFRTAFLEAKIGGSWSTIATYDAAVGFESVAFTRAGELIWPAEGANGARFMHKGEFVDGYANLGGEPAVVRKIAAQNSGRFTSAADMKTVLRLADCNDTEPSEGNATFWTCRAFCVGYLDFLASNVVSQYRLRIPVQAVAESYYQIGAAVVGYVQPFGKQWSDGYSRSMTPNVATSVSRHGTSRTLQQGPPRRSWSMSWQDGVALSGLETSNPNYYSATGGAALVAQDDVWTLNEGMLEEIQGGEIPVVALAKIPDAAGTVNQRDLFCYGRLSSEVQLNQVTGDEADDTFGRVESITVEEIK